jgi:hypothetical protein
MHIPGVPDFVTTRWRQVARRRRWRFPGETVFAATGAEQSYTIPANVTTFEMKLSAQSVSLVSAREHVGAQAGDREP